MPLVSGEASGPPHIVTLRGDFSELPRLRWLPVLAAMAVTLVLCWLPVLFSWWLILR